MNARLPTSLAPAFAAGATRLLESHSAIASQILADIEAARATDPDYETLPKDGFNDDDLFVYVDATLRFVRRIGFRSPEYRYPQLKAGVSCAHGLRAKYLSLWRDRSAA